MKKTLAIIVSALFSIVLYAQNENDALRYSLINYNGTARFSGLSGAYGAVGADFSTLSQNPAGIGLYRKSEFSITPIVASNTTESSFLNNTNSEFRNTLYLANAGYIMSIKLNENNGSHLKQIQFGFGMNRSAIFNNRILVEGLNNDNSLMTNYLLDATNSGTNPDNLYQGSNQFGAALAYDANLLFQDSIGTWQADLPFGGLDQSKTIETWGGTTETVLSAGTNFDDKLFMGVTFGFPRINYHEETLYSEKDGNSLSPFLKSFDRSEYLYTKGSGFNFKFGFIFKPVEFIRIGGALHTPTSYYDMNDTYSATMTSYFDQPPLTTTNATRFEVASPDGAFNYKITTPMRAMGSLAVVIGQHGVISADYEYIDYSTARLRGGVDYSFSEENKSIRTTLTSANNFRFGTEWKAGIYAIRGGYSLYGSPYTGESMSGLGSRTGYSFGFGIREKLYFLDFAFSHTDSKANYYIYYNAPVSVNTYSSNVYSLTLGFRL